MDYVLCHKVYHCTPLELYELPANVVFMHWTMYQAEIKVDNKRKQVAADRRRKHKKTK